MCYLAGFKKKCISDAKPNIFLPIDLYKKIIDEVSKEDVFTEKKMPFSLVLTGGEAFLHPDISTMLRYAKFKNVGVTVFTNGTLIDDDLANQIIDQSLEALMFSVDGCQESHDKLRGDGNFKKTFDAINRIRNLKKKMGRKSPSIFINTLVHNFNIDHLEKVIEMCDGLEIAGLSFSLVQWSDPDLTKKALSELEERLNWKAPLSRMIEAMEHNFYIKESEADQLIARLELIRRNHQDKHPFYINFFPDLSSAEIRLWCSNNIYSIDNCQSVRDWIRVGANGDVYPVCALMPFSWGNIADKTIGEIVNGNEARIFFNEIRERGFFYVCHRCCRRPSWSKCVI
jgi:MoaA/NifB/PqqE/SkfB family radical SAM enzyme